MMIESHLEFLIKYLKIKIYNILLVKGLLNIFYSIVFAVLKMDKILKGSLTIIPLSK